MSMTTEAFERIRDAIVSGGLEFGEHLSETQIATALGMSKAPVRAAFIELRDKGLVTIVPQSGTYVFSPTADDVRTMSEFRALLENQALAEAYAGRRDVMLGRMDEAIRAMRKAIAAKNWDAYRNADSSFHLAFLEECGNRFILKAYHLTSTALEALRVRLQRGAGNYREQSFREHCEIAALLREGKTKAAAAILRQHILVINQSLHTLPLSANKGSRKDKPDDRDYASVFAERIQHR
ncbi:MAG: GntR family transcriptional regulator [Mesorhizobium sp.]|nr:GntR family transcriptional regulator [Mesorhizobium sp.]MBL8576535.1 GntR family transcriptional regulator [Mesorhizobium sp.]